MPPFSILFCGAWLNTRPRRLGRHFGNSPRFRLGLQMDHDLEEAARRLDAA